MKVGVGLKPKTPVESVLSFIDLVDMVLIMTVEPGFGGQKFMADMMPKVTVCEQHLFCLRLHGEEREKTEQARLLVVKLWAQAAKLRVALLLHLELGCSHTLLVL